MPATVLRLLREHWARLLLGGAIFVHLLMMASLFWGYLSPLFSDSDLHRQGIDFFAIYEAGRNVLEGRSVYYYDALDTVATPYHTPYRYVPAFAYAFAVPINAVPAWWAYWGWVAFYELLLVANAYVTWRVGGKGTWALIGAAMWFVFTPFYLEQYMGQFSFLMATALLWVGIGIARGRESVAGPPWLVSLTVKANSALLLPLFLRLGWWRTLGAAIVIGAINMIYFAGRGREFGYLVWLNLNGIIRDVTLRLLQYEPGPNAGYFFVESQSRFFQYNPAEQGAVALMRNSLMTLDPTASDMPAALPAALVAGIVGLSLAATFLPRKVDPLALFAIWISTFFLTFTVWEHHYVMYLPVVTLLVALRPASRPWALVTFALVALPTPYWLLENLWNTAPVPPANVLISHQDSWPAWGVVLQHAIKPLPVLALWGYLVTSQLRAGLDLRRFSVPSPSLRYLTSLRSPRGARVRPTSR